MEDLRSFGAELLTHGQPVGEIVAYVVADKGEHRRGDIGNVSRGICYTHHCGHVGMDLAVKEIGARQVEVDRERPALRLVLIHDDVRTDRLHQQGNCMLRTSAAVIDLKIHPLTGFYYRKRGAGQLTLEPVTRFIGEAHSVNRAAGSVNRAWGDHG